MERGRQRFERNEQTCQVVRHGEPSFLKSVVCKFKMDLYKTSVQILSREIRIAEARSPAYQRLRLIISLVLNLSILKFKSCKFFVSGRSAPVELSLREYHLD